jgi:hypothetical protein
MVDALAGPPIDDGHRAEQDREQDQVLAQRATVRDLVPVAPEHRGVRTPLIEPEHGGRDGPGHPAEEGDGAEEVPSRRCGSDGDVHGLIEPLGGGWRNGHKP